jgi:hypothetical protein
MILFVTSVLALIVPPVAHAATRSQTIRLTSTFPAASAPGRAVQVSGRVHSSSGSVRVTLQQQTAGRWITRAQRRLAAHRSAFALTLRVPKSAAGSLVLRVAVFRGNHLAASSRVRAVEVKLPVVVVKPRSVKSVPAPGTAGQVRLGGHENVKVGDVIASGIGPATPFGFLGRADSVHYQAGDTIVQAHPISLIDAVPEGTLNAALASTASYSKAKAASAFNQGIGKAISCQDGGQVGLTGSIGLSASANLSAHWNWWEFGVTTASFTGTVTASASLEATDSAKVSCKLAKTPLLAHPINLPSIDVQVGPVPVVITPQVQLYIESEASASASISAGVHGSLSATAGLKWNHGNISPIGSDGSTFGFNGPSVQGSAHLGGKLIPSLDLLLYGVAGPRASFSAGLSLDADINKNPWWTLTAPLELDAALVVPDLNLSTPNLKVFGHTFTLARASGPFGPPQPPPPLPPPPPAAGAARHITSYATTEDLGCSLTTQEDLHDEFYTDGSANDACGTFLAYGGQLYGPANIPAGGNLGSYIHWTPVSQNTTGDGSTAQPYTTTTTVTGEGTGVQLTEIDSWVNGDNKVNSTYQVSGVSGDTSQVVLYHAADCYAGGSDEGSGSFNSSSQTVGCVHDNGDGTFFQEQFTPQTSGAQSVEDLYSTVWSDIAIQTLLPGTCTCNETHDNGAGVSWAFPLNGTTPITQRLQLAIVEGNA